MASQIGDTCTNCAVCAPLCPTSSILPGQNRFVIDADSCENCKICIPVCPVDAIKSDKKS
jgi:NAD-dependent dihydropyrimidine dehydrogenase PreA subunit